MTGGIILILPFPMWKMPKQYDTSIVKRNGTSISNIIESFNLVWHVAKTMWIKITPLGESRMSSTFQQIITVRFHKRIVSGCFCQALMLSLMRFFIT